MSETSTRRQFMDRAGRVLGFVTIGGAAGLLVKRASANSVYQVDPSRCTSCDLCRTSCVLSHSAVKAVNDFSKCGYCMLCPAYMDVSSMPDERGIPTGLVCPQDALKRRVVGTVDPDDPNNNYYEYTVDESKCDGCGKCVKACLPPAGNGSLRLEIRYDRCVECNQCAIQIACPDHAILRVDVPGLPPVAAAMNNRLRPLLSLAFVVALLASGVLMAQYQKQPPDFGGSYSFPTPTHPEPKDTWVHALDVVMLIAGLGIGAWLILKRRTRNGVLMLSVASVAYFGFYRQGCICPIGAIQNVTASLVDPRYLISFGVITFFFLPLAATLLFGRVFCGGVCPLGAVQDLVLVRPVTVPRRLDQALRWVPYLYLALAVMFAGWGLHLSIGSWQLNMGRRFIICEWDPFISIFRVSGPFHMLVISGGFILTGMFVGRPYCRWLCPYGGLLSLLSRVAWKNVSITPNKEVDCGLCAGACPFGSIHNHRADRATCVSCARCYDSCPFEIERRGGPSADVQLARLVPR